MSTASTFPMVAFPLPPELPPQMSQPAAGRRRASREQGVALETLGHAIEYLVDSRLFEDDDVPADAAAVRVLMMCSRAVFSECEEVQPWRQRVQNALTRRLHSQLRIGAAS